MGAGDNKNTAKRGKAQPNPIDQSPPQEYLSIVGSPSITFNGYMLEDGKGTPSPAPADLSKVPQYIGYPYGGERFTQTNGQGTPIATHDLYWANFIDPAIRLHANAIVKAPPGSIVTLLLWYPGYAQRAERDWDASPYNSSHRRSPWVAQGVPDKSKPQPAPRTPSNKPKVASKPQAPPSKAESDIDHDILMRTTSGNEPDRGIVKWPKNKDVYLEYLLDATTRIVYGLGGLNSASPKAALEDVMVKLLLASDIDQVKDYITSGTWTGRYAMNTFDRLHWQDEDEEGYEDMKFEGDDDSADPNYNFKISFSSRRWSAYWKQSLKKGPSSVDRSKIRIRRFDYFGHSGYDQMFLAYGLTNKKGEEPGAEVMLADTTYYNATKGNGWPLADLQSLLNAKTVVKGATAKLWGCFLGAGMAPALARTFKEVVACENRTSFDRILDNDTNMPEPVSGAQWSTYKP